MSKAEQLQRKYGANIADSLGHGAAPPAAAAPLGPDRYRGMSKGKGGEMLIGNIVPDPGQPRKEFDAAELQQLAETVRKRGQLQPIRVRWQDDLGKWVIVLGERRYRAAQIAGLTKVACIFMDREMTRGEILLDQLIENGQRSGLKDIEQAKAYKELMQLEGWSGAQVAAMLQVHRATVNRALQLLELPESIQADIEAGRIPPAAGVEIGKLRDPAQQAELAGEAAGGGMTRADVAEAVRRRKGAGSSVVKIVLASCTIAIRFREAPTEEQVREVLREALELQEERRAA